MRLPILPILVSLLAACGSPPTARTIRLVTSHYSLSPGSEGYRCQTVTVPEELLVKRLTPVSPAGVHHTVLGLGRPGDVDGVHDCGPFIGNPVFASGVSSDGVTFPEPAAVKLAAGSQVVLNLHLFNASAGTIEGDAGVDAEVVPAGSAYTPAGITLAGPLGFIVDTSRTVEASCTVNKRATWFALFPHMHQTGQHMRVWRENSAGQTVVWDEDFSFEQQTIANLAPLELEPGDRIRATCTYTADGVGKGFGDSSTSEMCFAVSFTYPELGGICAG